MIMSGAFEGMFEFVKDVMIGLAPVYLLGIIGFIVSAIVTSFIIKIIVLIFRS